ncbi:MAG TPA: GNAT family N-acetyltransferase [Microlunatus sp.]
MPMPSRRVWRAAPATLAAVGLFCVAAGVCIPVLAYLVLLREQSPAVPIFLVVLAVFALGYGWRFGLHPSLRADEHGVVVNNPGRRVRFGWSEITVLAPGGNGLIVGSESDRAEAWCIQKSRWAVRRGSRTRADRIVDELCELQDQYDPPLEDDETGIRIRRARWHEYGLLTRIERSASRAALSHVFPAAEYPYPTVAVRRRWRRLLRDRMIQIRVLEHWETERIETPVGLVAFETAGTIRHLAIVPEQFRRGYGSLLLEYATEEIFDSGASTAQLWVLVDNTAARAFYRRRGWTETGQRGEAEYPPHPAELMMVRPNPTAPRRRS